VTRILSRKSHPFFVVRTLISLQPSPKEKRLLKGARGKTFSARRGFEPCSYNSIYGGVSWLTSILTSICAGSPVPPGF